MNRRDFFKDAAALTLTAAMSVEAAELLADSPRGAPQQPAPKLDDDDKVQGPPVNCAVIGLSYQGREMLSVLAKMGVGAPVSMVCDTFAAPNFLKKATAIAPSAKVVDDYRKVLDDKSVQAVFVVTPTHKHKQIVLDALAAEKNVYCEAPLSNDLDEAKAIAKAGKEAKTIFQSGLQSRSNKQNHHVFKFVESGQLGDIAFGRAQYHERTNWVRLDPRDERQRELNWRLRKETSLGLIGEIGIHQIDTASWFFKALPVSVTGFSGIMAYNDGRTVPDTVQCVVEYPNNVRFVYDATLANSFEGRYETFYGTVSAIQLRDLEAWMIKEVDSKLNGWEPFARKDHYMIRYGDTNSGRDIGTGIALVADATKQLKHGLDPGKTGTDLSKSALYQAVLEFLNSINQKKQLGAGPVEGYQATVVACKANEAALSGNKLTFEKTWFEI